MDGGGLQEVGGSVQEGRVFLSQGSGDHDLDCFVGLGDEVGGCETKSGWELHVAEVNGLWARWPLQFIFDPELCADGRALVIISPALCATEMRKSWISWRSRSLILDRVER